MRRSLDPIHAIVFLVLAAGCNRQPTAGAESASTAASLSTLSVRTATVSRREWAETIEVNGNLEATERSTLGAKVAGRVTVLNVDVGSEVKAGDEIARVDDVDLRLRVTQVESLVRQARAVLGLPLAGDDDSVESENTAQVRLARAVLAEANAKRDRAVALNQEGVLEDEQLDEAVAAAKIAAERVESALETITSLRGALEQRRAELAIARQQLSDTVIRAPYAGIVSRRLVGRGDYVTVGAPLVALVQIDPLRLLLEIRELDAARIRIGQAVRFRVDGSPVGFTATLVRLPPELRAENRTLLVEAEVANTAPDGSHPLRAGSFARASIVIDEAATALAVPVQAIRSFAGVDRVITIEDGKAKELLVKLGRSRDGFIEVVSDIADGTIVVLDPGNLQTGRPVVVAN
jgi:RND family efflux transporter MFP subunit